MKLWDQLQDRKQQEEIAKRLDAIDKYLESIEEYEQEQKERNDG